MRTQTRFGQLGPSVAIGALLATGVCLAIAPSARGQVAETSVRIATFNVALNRDQAGRLREELSEGKSAQAAKVARIVQTVRPHILLINELDYEDGGTTASLLHDRYLNQGPQKIEYAYRFVATVNTGVPSGLDLNGNGKTSDAEDCFGFGRFPGQYGMAVFSAFPVATDQVRTFQKFLWKVMPHSLFPPCDVDTHESIYDAQTMEVLRLSSKSHWDVPIKIGENTIHFLVSHPTPPVFDGPEDRNGRRNHDEIRLWADYIDPNKSAYLVDDQGRAGGLTRGAKFVIAGDLNADPHDGDAYPGAIAQLLEHPLIDSQTVPASSGGEQQSALQGGVNRRHQGAARHDTGDFPDEDRSPGNLRMDYVLPSRTLIVTGAGVFWPSPEEPEFAWVDASDHRLVWIDVQLGDD